MTDTTHSLSVLFRIGLSIHNLNKLSERKFGLSVVQWLLLRRLIQMPAASAQALAGAVGVHPSTLTQSLKRLHKKEIIFITDDPRDSRRKMISVTRLGKNVLDNADQRMRHMLGDTAKIKPSIRKIDGYLAELLALEKGKSPS